MPVEFCVLGGVQAHLDGHPIDLGHARQWCVLSALLVDANHPVSVDHLIERAWGSHTPQRVRSALYTYVSRLRQALTAVPDVDITRAPAGGYVLRIEPLVVDLHRFQYLTRRARTANDTDALELLEQALDLWQGEAFASLDTPWLTTVRGAFERQRMAAELDRNDLALRCGLHDRLLPDLSAAAAAHPLDERLAGQLMLAFYHCGRQADALAQYEQTRRLLAEELGADPSPALRRVHQKILTNDRTVDATVAITSGTGSATAARGRDVARSGTAAPADRRPGRRIPAQLPADVRAFTGRDQELSQLDDVLEAVRASGAAHGGAAPAVLISTVSGTAGVGKTSLAVHWAHRARDAFPDGQLFVNLRGYDSQAPLSPSRALAGFLDALGIAGADIPSDVDDRAALYRTALAGRRMLVMLDNAGSVEQIRPLLPGTPTCLVLVTSRDSLAGLVALHGAQRLDLDLLPPDKAVELLRQLIGARADAEPAAAGVLARQCARLPLALRVAAELAASRPATTLATLVAELTDLRQRLDLLDGGGDPRAAVRVVFSWSYRHLSADTAQAFRSLGLHPGVDVDSAAVAALTGSSVQRAQRLLVALDRAHLMESVGNGRHSMHDLLGAYAAERAAADDSAADRRTALTRLFDHYLATAMAAMDILQPSRENYVAHLSRPAGRTPLPLRGPVEARSWLDQERANLVAACTYTARHGWEQHTVAIAATLWDYLRPAGHYTDAVTIYTDARNAARHSGDAEGEAFALTVIGYVHRQRAEWSQSIDCFRQALSLSHRLHDTNGEAIAIIGIGIALMLKGEFAPAASHLKQALTIFTGTSDYAGQVETLSYLGSLYARQGRLQQSHEHLLAALTICRRTGDQVAEAFVLHALGMLFNRQGALEQATGHLQQSLTLFKQTGHATGEVMALTGLGLAHILCGRLDQADTCLNHALTTCRQMGYRSEELRVLHYLEILSSPAVQSPDADTILSYPWSLSANTIPEQGT